jgi:FkbM family methyltransferase
MTDRTPLPAHGRKYQDIRPGLDTLRYLTTYGLLTWLAQRTRRRPQRLFVDISSNVDRHVLSEGLYEKGLIDVVRDVCTATGCTEVMVDIGANIGNHTVALARQFKAVEAVEPHPVLFRILEANVLRNGLAHVRCHNVGMAADDATATLTEEPGNHALNRVRERSQLDPKVFGLSAESFGTEYSIQLRSARAFLEELGPRLERTFIKIDVEGMEEEILDSIAPLIERHRPLVGFEWYTPDQPRLARLAQLPGHELWGIRGAEEGQGRLRRALGMFLGGRSYSFERIDTARLAENYPMALLVPRPR